MALLKDHQFNELCKLLKISGLHPNDSDKKTIEKAFRRLALKTHPDKGGDPIEFKKINEAYNKLIGHVTKLDAMEAEAELSRTSVIIEISKQAVPKWKEKLKGAYGLPKSQAKVNNVLFNVSFRLQAFNLIVFFCCYCIQFLKMNKMPLLNNHYINGDTLNGDIRSFRDHLITL